LHIRISLWFSQRRILLVSWTRYIWRHIMSFWKAFFCLRLLRRFHLFIWVLVLAVLIFWFSCILTIYLFLIDFCSLILQVFPWLNFVFQFLQVIVELFRIEIGRKLELTHQDIVWGLWNRSGLCYVGTCPGLPWLVWLLRQYWFNMRSLRGLLRLIMF
jgi:hypothetical protein